METELKREPLSPDNYAMIDPVNWLVNHTISDAALTLEKCEFVNEINMEASAGIEPAYTDLQSAA